MIIINGEVKCLDRPIKEIIQNKHFLPHICEKIEHRLQFKVRLMTSYTWYQYPVP